MAIPRKDLKRDARIPVLFSKLQHADLQPLSRRLESFIHEELSTGVRASNYPTMSTALLLSMV